MLPPIFQRPLWTGVAGVSSAHPLATKAGLNILKAGGNAVDAAVAVSAALNVVEFYHTSLAGGGFGLLYWAETGETMAIDFRGCAPKKATRDMFLGRLEDAAEGPQAVLVPGLLRGLGQIHSRYGRTSWDQLWVDAIEIAEEGFYLGPAYASITEFGIKKGRATRFEETARTFLDKGRPYGAGKPFRQRELAQVMRTIQTEGPEGFYSGWVAERFLEGLDSLGGIITADDLVDYRSSITPAVQGIYQDVTCHTPGLPCGGGLQIIMMLNILEQFDLKALGYSADYFQLLLQALEVGFAHRLEYFGDPRFVDDPTERLLSKEYARSLSLEGPMASGSSRPTGQGGTTHFVVADAEGNVVSWTQTIGEWYGSGVTIPGTGLLLNNTMSDFAPQPGVPNSHGYIYSEANGIAGGKAPLSSQSPMIICRDGRPILAVGAAGGPRIISSVLQVILHILEHGRDVASALHAPRIHGQIGPVLAEPGFSVDTLGILQERGWPIELIDSGQLTSFVHALTIDEGRIQVGADPRTEGAGGLLTEAPGGETYLGVCSLS